MMDINQIKIDSTYLKWLSQCPMELLDFRKFQLFIEVQPVKSIFT